MVDEVVDGKLDVVEPKFSVVENPTSRKPDTIRVGPSSRKPEHRVVEPSRNPDNRGKQPDNHQDLSTTGKFNNEKLVDGKFDNLDERGADEDEKAQEVSLKLYHFQACQMLLYNFAIGNGISIYVLNVKEAVNIKWDLSHWCMLPRSMIKSDICSIHVFVWFEKSPFSGPRLDQNQRSHEQIFNGNVTN